MKLRIVLNIVLLAVVVTVTAGVVGWMLTRPPKPKPPEPKRVVPKVVAEGVELRSNYTVEIVGYGSARPIVSVALVPQVSGKVEFCAPNLRSGMHVQAGELLCRIDQTDYKQQRAAAEQQIALLTAQRNRLDQEERNLKESEKLARGRVKLAEEQLADAERLRQRGAASTNDVDVARDTLLARKEQLQQTLNLLALIEPQRKQLAAEQAVRAVQQAQAQTAIDRTELTSPVTGRVLQSQVEHGAMITAGQTYGQLYDMRVMEIPVPVPASDLAWIDRSLLVPDKDGKTLAEKKKLIRAKVEWFARGDGRTMSWDGYVGRIEAGLEERTRTAKLVVYVENPPRTGGGDLLDRNMFCRVTIYGKTVPQTIIIPRQAIGPDGSVYVVEAGRLGVRQIDVLRYTDSQAMLLPAEPIDEGVAATGQSRTRPATRPSRGLRPGDLLCIGYIPAPVAGMRVDVVAPPNPSRPAPRPAAPSTRPAPAPALPVARAPKPPAAADPLAGSEQVTRSAPTLRGGPH